MGPETRPPLQSCMHSGWSAGLVNCLVKGFCYQPKINVIPQMVLGLKMTIFFFIKSYKVGGVCV